MRFGFFKKVIQKIDQIFTGRGRIDEELFEELEALLIQGDVNVHTTLTVLNEVRKAVQEERMAGSEEVIARLKSVLIALLHQAGNRASCGLTVADTPPTLYLIVGVNGVGKTTTIAKLAYRLQKQGKRVILAAGDTFRAAAIDQLEIWAGRIGAEIVKHREGTDPSAVIFDAIRAARARQADYVIADTAGRLHTRYNLMEELKKIHRVAERELGRPADETLLVLDATTGQNGISQARMFMNALPLTGLVLAKLDGTARGGVVFTLADELRIPIKLVGVGEKPDALETFDPERFVNDLFARD
ncbi:MAG: signal recognition particle-docking protein FtsY [Chloroherpetonaceae bacterium]|nr:signal recognition particle-docking protein FtsY [Chthonomonadaceae bacterium]MDW8207512.1 signal recognition particle-docking protein FtsY [Chloroherpetonaceae bacterium]